MAPLLSSVQTLDTILSLESLTQHSFLPFGSVISCPLHPSAHVYPAKKPNTESNDSTYSSAISANQGTALKYSPIAQIIDHYPTAPSKHPGQSVHSLFACFPRTLHKERFFNVRILERHPFTTQTFAPLGLSQEASGTFYVVIVAPSSPGSLLANTESGEAVSIAQPPDLTKLRAFVARGNQAVVYGPGTWHAPMVVVGERRVDFLVTQFMSGVTSEDCEEVAVGEGVCVEILDERGEMSSNGTRDARL